MNRNRPVLGEITGAVNIAAAKRNALGKRKAELSPPGKKAIAKKRSALSEVTNALKKKAGLKNKDKGENDDVKKLVKTNKKKEVKEEVAPLPAQPESMLTRARSRTSLTGTSVLNEEEEEVFVDAVDDLKEKEEPTYSRRKTRSMSLGRQQKKQSEEVEIENSKENNTKVCKSSTVKHLKGKDEEENSLYKSAISSPTGSTISSEVLEMNKKNEKLLNEVKAKLPDGVYDFDGETGNDPYQCAEYVQDIFAYYKKREVKFITKKYLEKQKDMNSNMRSILVDWMVEVQESFEMNHETLYLAVKIMDSYLSKVNIKRDKLQLVGTTALYIAAKYDERCPPAIDDFCYICDDAYPIKDVLQMEQRVLKVLNFDIGFPLSYRFLRRYARCAKLEMDVLTLSRFILETSLMDYDLIDVKESMIAAASLFLALKINKVADPWTPTLIYYSGYTQQDLFDLSYRLLSMMQNPQSHLKTIRTKYSHKVFFEVAKIPLPDTL